MVVNNRCLGLQLTDQQLRSDHAPGCVSSKARVCRCDFTMRLSLPHIVAAVKKRAKVRAVQHSESRATPIIPSEMSREWHKACNRGAQRPEYKLASLFYARSCVYMAGSPSNYSATIGHVLRQAHHVAECHSRSQGVHAACLDTPSPFRVTEISSSRSGKAENSLGLFSCSSQYIRTGNTLLLLLLLRFASTRRKGAPLWRFNSPRCHSSWQIIVQSEAAMPTGSVGASSYFSYAGFQAQ
jgi:hypothetical protein